MWGGCPGPALDLPVDAYSEKKKVQMSRETGRDPTVSHHILKNPMTSFAEAKLGKMIDHSARAGFLKYNRQVRAATRPGIHHSPKRRGVEKTEGKRGPRADFDSGPAVR